MDVRVGALAPRQLAPLLLRQLLLLLRQLLALANRFWDHLLPLFLTLIPLAFLLLMVLAVLLMAGKLVLAGLRENVVQCMVSAVTLMDTVVMDVSLALARLVDPRRHLDHLQLLLQMEDHSRLLVNQVFLPCMLVFFLTVVSSSWTKSRITLN